MFSDAEMIHFITEDTVVRARYTMETRFIPISIAGPRSGREPRLRECVSGHDATRRERDVVINPTAVEDAKTDQIWFCVWVGGMAEVNQLRTSRSSWRRKGLLHLHFLSENEHLNPCQVSGMDCR